MENEREESGLEEKAEEAILFSNADENSVQYSRVSKKSSRKKYIIAGVAALAIAGGLVAMKYYFEYQSLKNLRITNIELY